MSKQIALQNKRKDPIPFVPQQKNRLLLTLLSAQQNTLGLREFCQEAEQLHLILLRISDYHLLDTLFGKNFVQQIRQQVNSFLQQSASQQTNCSWGSYHEIGFIELEPGEYLLLHAHNQQGAVEDFLDQAYSLKFKAQNELKQTFLAQTGQSIQFQVGYAHFSPTSKTNWEELFFQSLKEARRMAQGEMDLNKYKLSREFINILNHKQISTLYQPIYNCISGRILGWEALSRGPQDSALHSPLMLFDFAEEQGHLFDLEKTCREKAVANLGPFLPGQKLFINIHPRTVVDPKFTPGKTQSLLEEKGLAPENIVFEITERHNVRDFHLFHKTLEHYRSQGYKVAIDDVGAGYSGLWTLAKIRPDYIKIDMSLIRGIDRDPVKRALLETFITFADKIGSKIIAEGIETETEFTCLLSMNVHCVQGYYISRPQAPKPEVHINLEDKKRKNQVSLGEICCRMPVGSLCTEVYQVSEKTSVEEVRRIMGQDSPLSSVVVVCNKVPKGLIMSHHLDRHLASQYGVALYSSRYVTLLMDKEPLIVDQATPIELVAQQAMARTNFKTYDDIIVTSQGKLLGVVSVQKIIDAMAAVQVEMAKGTNPLTGLPGNVSLETEVENHLAVGRPASFIYADLDNFKVYNDVYGFSNGDKIILLLSRILSWAVKRHGSEDDFVAHIGGDDFVLITRPDRAERVCRAVSRCFKRLVKACYCEQDWERGWITAKGRDGKEDKFPMVSVSLGIVDCFGSCTLKEIGERAAEVKKYAKSRAGNSYVRDRRSPLGLEER